MQTLRHKIVKPDASDIGHERILKQQLQTNEKNSMFYFRIMKESTQKNYFTNKKKNLAIGNTITKF